VLREPRFNPPSWEQQQQQQRQQQGKDGGSGSGSSAAHDDINTFLQLYASYGGLAVNWVIFGSSGHAARPRGGVLVNYHACLPDQQEQNTHVKVSWVVLLLLGEGSAAAVGGGGLAASDDAGVWRQGHHPVAVWTLGELDFVVLLSFCSGSVHAFMHADALQCGCCIPVYAASPTAALLLPIELLFLTCQCAVLCVQVIANTKYLLTVGDDPHRVYYKSTQHWTVNELGEKVRLISPAW
jgi:hypothetical protein